MKLNNEDKRRLKEALQMKNRHPEMSFDEIAERYSPAAARKIRGTFNKIWKIKTDFEIDEYDTECYVDGNIYNSDTVLMYILMNFRNTQMHGIDLSRHIMETTGNYCYGLEAILNGLAVITDYSLISYSNTYGLDTLTIR